MKDNTILAFVAGLLMFACLLVLIGASPIQHWLEVPGPEWGAYDSSTNQLFKVRTSDKAFTINGVLDAAGIRAHGTIDAASQVMTVNASTARIANAQTMYATGAANALLLNASAGIFGGGAVASGYENTINGDEYISGSAAIHGGTYAGKVLSVNGDAYFAGSILSTSTTVGNGYTISDWGASSGGSARILEQRSGTEAYLQISQGSTASDQLLLKSDGTILCSTSVHTAGYDLIVNAGIYSGGTIYGAGTISGQTITDRTPGSPEDALSEIRKMEVVGEEIKHETLGFARSIRSVEQVSTMLYDEKSGAEIDSYDRALSNEEVQKIPDGVYVDEKKTVTQEDERDLSKLASLLTRAIQQLDARITALEGKL